jgi:hypothetical protein
VYQTRFNASVLSVSDLGECRANMIRFGRPCCYVEINGKNGKKYCLTIGATSAYVVVEKAMNAWSRLWWWDPDVVAIVRRNDESWNVPVRKRGRGRIGKAAPAELTTYMLCSDRGSVRSEPEAQIKSRVYLYRQKEASKALVSSFSLDCAISKLDVAGSIPCRTQNPGQRSK